MTEPFVYPAGLVTNGRWEEGEVMVAAGPQGRFETSAAAPVTATNSFETINCSSGTDPVAESPTDTLNLTGGTGITVTGDATTDTITIATTITQSSGADPTATAGQSAVNGAAATFMRSDAAPAVSTIYPSWTKYTVTFSDLAVADPDNVVTLFSLPARGVIHSVVMKQSQNFEGGAISTYTLEVGIVGTLGKYASTFDVFLAEGNTVFQISSTVGAENFGAATNITLHANADAVNLNEATQGSVDIFVLTSVTPALT